MGIFGWSYPPGCSGPPDEAEAPCLCCGNHPDECICPMCQKCGEIGDPACYPKHMGFSFRQILGQWAMRDAEDRAIEQERTAFDGWMEDMRQEDALEK